MFRLGALTVLILAVAATAQAQEKTSATAEVTLQEAVLKPRYRPPEDRIPGIAKTAVDQRLGAEATGSLGFLCGIKPSVDRYAAHGYDPNGRFIGAKLSLAFR